MAEPYQPVFELTRGNTIESIHYGAAVVVDSHGRLLASIGDPQTVTYLRSTAKPFQVMPFIEREGHKAYQFTQKEIAIMCASHSGTPQHVEVVKTIHKKAQLNVEDLQCGTHYPYHLASADAMKIKGEEPTAYCHNCSGKHSGMLAHAKMRNLPIQTYLQPEHPIQQDILKTFAEMADMPVEQVALGIDGCSAPNFASPLYNAALSYARLTDPFGLTAKRAAACKNITQAMMNHPDMVGGPERFDTQLMEIGKGQILSKEGAEGFQGLGLIPNALVAGSPGVGVAVKISDGDPTGRARQAVSMAILQALGALSQAQLIQLKEFGPSIDIFNYQKITVGKSQPTFTLEPTRIHE